MQAEEVKIKSDQRAKKVLFFPYYFYLQYEPFRQVIASLKHLGVEAYMVSMHCNHFDESKQFRLERFKNDGCPVKELPVYNIGPKGVSLFTKLMQFLGFLINRRKIENFLRAEQPALVVVGSDLGGIYIRFLLDMCHLLHIPMLIMVTVDFGAARSDANPEIEAKVPVLVRFLLRLLSMERLTLFNGWVIGSYSQEAKVLVPSKAMQDQLVRDGICRERILVIGSPLHDWLYELRNEPTDKIKCEICSSLGWSVNYRLIVYCTEVIHSIYGEDYLESVNKLLARAFQNLPAECRVVIKLHPRESVKSIAYFSRAFIGDRYRIVNDINIYRLLRVADLAIGHFSSTLLEAILLGTPVLSINVLGDQRRTLFSSSQDLVQIRSETEFTKIHDILYNTRFRDVAKALLERWIKDNVGVINGHSSERIARVIKHIIERRDV